MNRRLFLGGLAATATTLLLPTPVAQSEPTQRIWALGAIPGTETIHRSQFRDDTAYLQAIVNRDLARGQVVTLPSGIWTIDRTIHFPLSGIHVHGGQSRINRGASLDGPCFLFRDGVGLIGEETHHE